jgi:DNA-binding Lrp family transcriptional regulator
MVVNVFVISNPLSALIASQIICSEEKKTQTNIAILDRYTKKASLKKEIFDILSQYNWTSVIDLSITISDEADLSPGLVRRTIRKVKNSGLVKGIYKQLQNRKMQKIDEAIYKELKPALDKFDFIGKKIELFFLMQTYLNNSLLNYFPNASINYFEHGLGDYILSAKSGKKDATFYGLFAGEYKAYDKKSPLNYRDVSVHPITEQEKKAGKENVLILLQNVEIYHIKDEFWIDYLKQIIAKEGKEKKYIIKPHPLQHSNTLERIKNYLKENGLDFEINAMAACIEVSFNAIANTTTAVYSPFSSSLFYLSKMYSHYPIRFYHSLEKFSSLTTNAPLEYRNRLKENKAMMLAVFCRNTSAFNW